MSEPGSAKSRMERNELTAEFLRAEVNYSPETGVFTWARRKPKIRIGEVAGTLAHQGYIVIHIRGVDYFAHRLAWLYMFGEWPPEHVDHINRDRSDNRIANLRLASSSENGANVGVPKHNTSGFKGVSFYRQTRRWAAYINAGGQRTNLGYFATAEEAAVAYDRAAIAAFGSYALTNAKLAESPHPNPDEATSSQPAAGQPETSTSSPAISGDLPPSAATLSADLTGEADPKPTQAPQASPVKQSEPFDPPAFLRKTAADYRPHCLNPDNCGSSSIDRHCHTCRKAIDAARESEAA